MNGIEVLVGVQYPPKDYERKTGMKQDRLAMEIYKRYSLHTTEANDDFYHQEYALAA